MVGYRTFIATRGYIYIYIYIYTPVMPFELRYGTACDHFNKLATVENLDS